MRENKFVSTIILVEGLRLCLLEVMCYLNRLKLDFVSMFYMKNFPISC